MIHVNDKVNVVLGGYEDYVGVVVKIEIFTPDDIQHSIALVEFTGIKSEVYAAIAVSGEARFYFKWLRKINVETHMPEWF